MKIEEKQDDEPKFKPFTISIDTPEEAAVLFTHFNQYYSELLKSQGGYEIFGIPTNSEYLHKISDEMRRQIMKQLYPACFMTITPPAPANHIDIDFKVGEIPEMDGERIVEAVEKWRHDCKSNTSKRRC